MVCKIEFRIPERVSSGDSHVKEGKRKEHGTKKENKRHLERKRVGGNSSGRESLRSLSPVLSGT